MSDKKTSTITWVGYFMVIGVGLGSAIGVALDNIAVGVGAGIAVALVAGAIVYQINKR